MFHVPNGRSLPQSDHLPNNINKIVDLLSGWVAHLVEQVSENGFGWGDLLKLLSTVLSFLQRIKRRPPKPDRRVLHHLCETYRSIQPYSFHDFKWLVTVQSLHSLPEETRHVYIQLIFDKIIQDLIKTDGESKLGEKLDDIEREYLTAIDTYVNTSPTKSDKLRDESTSLERVNTARRRFLLGLQDIDINEKLRSIDDWLDILVDKGLQDALLDLEAQIRNMAKSIWAGSQYAKTIGEVKAKRFEQVKEEYHRVLKGLEKNR